MDFRPRAANVIAAVAVFAFSVLFLQMQISCDNPSGDCFFLGMGDIAIFIVNAIIGYAIVSFFSQEKKQRQKKQGE